MTSKCEICLETYTEDQLVSVGDCERFNRKRDISVVCSNCYDKDDCERCGEYDYEGDLCDTCNMCKDEHACCECCECGDCDYTITRGEFERGKGRIMFNDIKEDGTEFRCGCCDDRVNDPMGEHFEEEDYTEERCDTCKKVLTYGDEQGCDCEEEDVGTKGYEPEQLEEGEKVWVSRIEEEDISHLSDKEYIFWLEHKIDKLEEEIRNGDTDKCGCGHCGK